MDIVIDEVVGSITDRLATDCRSFVLDGVEELTDRLSDELRRRAMMHVLSGHLHGRGITGVIPMAVLATVGPELDLERTPLAALAQNLILMRFVEFRGELWRILSVLKVRDSGFDASIRSYTISGAGLRVLSREDTPKDLLAGIAHLPSEAWAKRTEPDPGA